MIDNAIDELHNNSYIDNLIDTYERDYPGGFYRVASPYRIPTK